MPVYVDRNSHVIMRLMVETNGQKVFKIRTISLPMTASSKLAGMPAMASKVARSTYGKR